jgi:hypothetical protein
MTAENHEPQTATCYGIPVTNTSRGMWKAPELATDPKTGEKFRLVVREVEKGRLSMPPPAPLPFEDVEALLAMDLATDWLVKWVVARDQLGVIAGAVKTLKTSIAFDLVLSLCFAKPFLGVFEVPAEVRAGLFLGETTRKMAAKIIHAMCWAKQIDPAKVPGKLALCLQLPKPAEEGGLEVLALSVRGLAFAAFDPMYLMKLAGENAANVFQMGPFIASVAETCLGEGCTPFLVHHNTKDASRAYGMPELHDTTMSGTQEHAAQWILLGREGPMTKKPHRLLANIGGREGHFCQKVLVIDDGDGDRKRWDVKVYDYDREEAQQVRAEAREQRRDVAREAKDLERLEEARPFDKGSGISKADLRAGLGLNNEVASDLLVRWAHRGWIEILDGKKVTDREMRFRVRKGQKDNEKDKRTCPESESEKDKRTLSPPSGGESAPSGVLCPFSDSDRVAKQSKPPGRPPAAKRRRGKRKR